MSSNISTNKQLGYGIHTYNALQNNHLPAWASNYTDEGQIAVLHGY
jgi:hypothetical protein